MSVFRFRLETVRQLRKRAEDERAGDLADAMSDADSAEKEREDVAAVERAGREQLKQMHAGVARLQSVQVMLDQLEHHHEQAKEKCREAAEVVRDRQQAFVKAVTDRRAIERLKDRREKAWRQDVVRREQKILDEVNVTRHLRDDVGETEPDNGSEG